MPNDEIKSMHIAVYALSLLGGAHQKIHTEHVAKKCLELAPSRFRWEHFDYPEKELVRKALFHAGERKNGALVRGRTGMEQRGKSRDGWQLTEEGAIWIRDHESALRAAVGAVATAAIPKVEADRFVKRVKSQALFQEYRSTGNLDVVSRYGFTDLLNCTPDAPVETIRIKFDRLLSMAQLVNDEEVVSFLRTCRAKFASLLGEGKA